MSKIKSAAETAGSSKSSLARQRINVKIVQNVLLIWLDKNIDDNSADYCNTVTQLRRVVNNINTFTDGDQCIEFLNTITDNKVCMVISGSLGQHIVPHVHEMSQVDSIFIFCGNKQRHEQWAKEWSKIKNVFTEITPICESLKKAVQQCEQNAIPISFVVTSGDISKKNLDQLEPSFMYTQILKEILLSIKFEQKHIEEFIDHCRDVFSQNEGKLKIVDQLQNLYHDKTPIWWYTCESFLYPMLNGALRLMDVNTIIQMGFFIGDLHRHIQQLHSEQFNEHHSNKIFTVYRGQGMTKIDFDRMTKTKGGLISFNNFLFTSIDREVSLDFARRAVPNPDLMGIFFVMTIDPSISSAPFTSTADVGCDSDAESEVLFSMHTVFRIQDIKPMSENPHRLFQVDLTLNSDNDEDLRVVTDHIREESFPDEEGWYRLGSLLLKMGQSKKAQQVYEVILEYETDQVKQAFIYHRLGCGKDDLGKYEEAITFYNTALEIRQKSLRLNHPDLTKSYNNIANVYYKMGEYLKALSYYEKALEINQKSLPPNHPDLAKSYNSIGNVCYNMGEYSKALSSHKQALEIRQKSLPPSHPDLAYSYNNTGNVYYKMGKYLEALSYYEKALEINRKSLPLNHPDLAYSYNNIGLVYNNMDEYSKALSSQEKALEIRQKSLPPNHPDLSKSYNSIGNVYYKVTEYSKALSYYEKALEIYQRTLPSNHPDLGGGYNNIGLVYEHMSNYSKAHSFYERAVDIGKHSLRSNHPRLQQWRKNLERIKKKL